MGTPRARSLRQRASRVLTYSKRRGVAALVNLLLEDVIRCRVIIFFLLVLLSDRERLKLMSVMLAQPYVNFVTLDAAERNGHDSGRKVTFCETTILYHLTIPALSHGSLFKGKWGLETPSCG